MEGAEAAERDLRNFLEEDNLRQMAEQDLRNFLEEENVIECGKKSIEIEQKCLKDVRYLGFIMNANVLPSAGTSSRVEQDEHCGKQEKLD
jgi:hypothetical protein